MIGITASGQDHKKARKLRVAIEQALEEITGEDRNEE